MIVVVTKKTKGTKKCVIKQRLKFEDYKKLLHNYIKIPTKVKSEVHNVFTEKFTKVALIFKDHKRIQSFSKVKSYPYGINVGKVSKEELLQLVKAKN